jgi:hypothetical protein
MTTFRGWLATAPKGEAVVYHTGLLMKDRYSYAQGRWVPNQLHSIALMVWQAYRLGYVSLVQRKNEEFRYDYIAVKR